MRFETYEIAIESNGTITISSIQQRLRMRGREWKLAHVLPQIDGSPIEYLGFTVRESTDDALHVDYDTPNGLVNLDVRKLDPVTASWKMKIGQFPHGASWRHTGPFSAHSIHGFDTAYHSGRFGWEPAGIHTLGGTAAWHSDYVLGLLADAWLVLGFVTHRNSFTRFEYAAGLTPHSPSPSLERGRGGEGKAPLDRLTACCECEGVHVKDSMRAIAAEEMIITQGRTLDDALSHWADITASRMGARVRPLRSHASDCVIAYDSWYQDYQYGSHARCISALKSLKSERRELPFTHFIIGMGYHANLGDWLDPNPAYGPPVTETIAAIKDAGLKPGIWFAPFMVGNRSKLNAAHPDWLARRHNGLPYDVCSSYGEPRLWFGNEEIYAADPTNPEFINHVGHCARVFREEWGVDLLKLDFCHYACMPDSVFGSEAIGEAAPAMTHAQAYRLAMRAIRDAFGDGFILASSAPLCTSIGLVDGCRVNGEVGPEWVNWYNSTRSMRAALLRAFMHRRFWLNDGGPVTARDFFSHLDPNEARTRGLVQSVTGAVFTTGDDVGRLSANEFSHRDRHELLRFLLPIHGTASVASDLGPQQWTVLLKSTVIGEQAFSMLAIVNLGEDESTVELDLRAHGLTGSSYHVFDLWRQTYLGRKHGVLKAVVPVHGSVLYSVSEACGEAAEVVCAADHVTGAESIGAITCDESSIEIVPLRTPCRAIIFAPDGIDAPEGVFVRDLGDGAFEATIEEKTRFGIRMPARA